MKENKSWLLLALLMFVVLPISIKAKEFNITYKYNEIEKYVCDELKGHELIVIGPDYDRILVYDNTLNKEYWIDFKNIGVCYEYVEENFGYSEYEWINNNLIYYEFDEYTYNGYYKTKDTAVDSDKFYMEKTADGYKYVSNPSGDMSQYYESGWFIESEGEYDENKTYYIYKMANNGLEEYEEVLITENDYQPNAYYELVKPNKKEILGNFENVSFVVPAEKASIEEDITFAVEDLLFHINIGNKNYFIFSDIVNNEPMAAFFNEKGEYQTFGLDSLFVMDMYYTADQEYLSFISIDNGKPHVLLMDKDFNVITKFDASEFQSPPFIISYNENVIYYLVDQEDFKILEVIKNEAVEDNSDDVIIDNNENENNNNDDVIVDNDANDSVIDTENNQDDTNMVIDNKYKVVFDANEGSFKDSKKTLVIDEWKVDAEKTLENPTREGYKFLGYFTEKVNGIALEKYLTETGVNKDLTFYAQWEKEQVVIEEKEENPKTIDNIITSFLVCGISLIGTFSALTYLRKRMTKIQVKETI